MRQLHPLVAAPRAALPPVHSFELLSHLWKDPLVGFTILNVSVGIARGLHPTLQRHALIVLPKMFLGTHCLERFILLGPDRGDVEKQLRGKITLLRLVRFEQEDGRRT